MKKNILMLVIAVFVFGIAAHAMPAPLSGVQYPDLWTEIKSIFGW